MKIPVIGLMGGTFDPVHNGHLFIAQEALENYGLDIVYFIPSAYPPHKRMGSSASPADRCAMALAAVEDNPFFRVSMEEINRGGVSYTIDTVKRFKQSYKEKAEFYFIIGFDSYSEFGTWKDAAQLINECSFITAPRKDADRKQMLAGLKKGFCPLDIPVMEVSSTDIRNRVASGRCVRYLVPEKVFSYIQQNNLYRNK